MPRDVYEGEWRDDKRHGVGRHVYASGGTYEGEWADDQRHGRGIFRFADGNTYEGEFEGGKMQASLILSDPILRCRQGTGVGGRASLAPRHP